MACRDLRRADMAAQKIRGDTGNGNVVIRHLNLASLYSIREFAKEFLATEERLDILINNAGKSSLVIFLREIITIEKLSREISFKTVKDTSQSKYMLYSTKQHALKS